MTFFSITFYFPHVFYNDISHVYFHMHLKKSDDDDDDNGVRKKRSVQVSITTMGHYCWMAEASDGLMDGWMDG